MKNKNEFTLAKPNAQLVIIDIIAMSSTLFEYTSKVKCTPINMSIDALTERSVFDYTFVLFFLIEIGTFVLYCMYRTVNFMCKVQGAKIEVPPTLMLKH